MTILLVAVLCILAVWLAGALYLVARLGLTLHQAVLYAPLKLLYRIDDRRMKAARAVEAPVIYVVCHQSRLDPVLMLSLLPANTLHILDPASARSNWLEPWRELARTIAFNAHHVFVSRRLVRVLKGKGRLAVYIPAAAEPDAKAFRLYRAVARIATNADARIVPVFIAGTKVSRFSLTVEEGVPLGLLPRLTIGTGEGLTLPQLQERPGSAPATASGALFDAVAATRLAATDLSASLVEAARNAADRFGRDRPILEDVDGKVSYRRLLAGARALSGPLAVRFPAGEAVGLLLPPASRRFATTLLALNSAALAALPIDAAAKPEAILRALKMAGIRTVVASRALAESPKPAALIAAMEKAGIAILWREELQRSLSLVDRTLAALSWRRPRRSADGSRPAVLLTGSDGGEPERIVVLSSANLAASAAQTAARLALSPADRLCSTLPPSQAMGLTAGLVLPLVTGVRTLLPPPEPDPARSMQPTILIGDDASLAAYAKEETDFAVEGLRLVLAAEPVRRATRQAWRERTGLEIVEGYALPEAAGLVAVNTATHGREGSSGRLMPAMEVRIEPSDTHEPEGRLWIRGPNVLLGSMSEEAPGVLQPPLGGWHDTGRRVAIDREGYLRLAAAAEPMAKSA